MNLSRWIGRIGRTLIGSGVLILLFVAYQLWGTSLQESRAQRELGSDFETTLNEALGDGAAAISLDGVELPTALDESALAEVTPAASVGGGSGGTGDTTGDSGGTDDARAELASGNLASTRVLDTSGLPGTVRNTDVPPPPTAPEGEAVARIVIPRIDLDKTVVEGVTTSALKKGPGHYPGTPLPGQPGNAAIAGHRTTYGAPFGDLDKLEENDLIYVTTVQGSFAYRVTDTLIVSPRDVWVLDPTDDNRLTLTTCHPKWTARQRMIVVAELVGEPATFNPDALFTGGTSSGARADNPDDPTFNSGGDTGQAAPATTTPGASTSTTAATPATSTPTASTAPTTSAAPTNADGGSGDDPRRAVVAAGSDTLEGADAGLAGRSESIVPAVIWGLLAAAVALGIWLLSERWRRWPAYLLGAPVFLVVLFVFFENISLLLPANV